MSGTASDPRPFTPLQHFAAELSGPEVLEHVQAGLIGDGMKIATPFGTQTMLYADYVASGRALRQIERFVMDEVLPIYSSSHTEASHCGQAITRMRAEARNIIAREATAGPGWHVLFSGNGATGGLNRIVRLLDISSRIARGEAVRVLIGPYEQHSNILPWRESEATVLEVAEAVSGGVDLTDLEAKLSAAQGADLIVGSFFGRSKRTAGHVRGRALIVKFDTRPLAAQPSAGRSRETPKVTASGRASGFRRCGGSGPRSAGGHRSWRC